MYVRNIVFFNNFPQNHEDKVVKEVAEKSEHQRNMVSDDLYVIYIFDIKCVNNNKNNKTVNKSAYVFRSVCSHLKVLVFPALGRAPVR